VLDLKAAGLIDTDDMNALMGASVKDRQALRAAISEGPRRRQQQGGRVVEGAAGAGQGEMAVPCRIGDYTDFYVGIHHATTVGKQFRPDQPLLPNYKWVPIGYHGRASSIGVSGQVFKRPQGQTKAPDAAEPASALRSAWTTNWSWAFRRPRQRAGRADRHRRGRDHLFGVTLLNDWSARDLQAWEYQPLGPFLAKNFAARCRRGS
jgi:fumarylacetoacetase